MKYDADSCNNISLKFQQV